MNYMFVLRAATLCCAVNSIRVVAGHVIDENHNLAESLNSDDLCTSQGLHFGDECGVFLLQTSLAKKKQSASRTDTAIRDKGPDPTTDLPDALGEFAHKEEDAFGELAQAIGDAAANKKDRLKQQGAHALAHTNAKIKRTLKEKGSKLMSAAKREVPIVEHGARIAARSALGKAGATAASVSKLGRRRLGSASERMAAKLERLRRRAEKRVNKGNALADDGKKIKEMADDGKKVAKDFRRHYSKIGANEEGRKPLPERASSPGALPQDGE